VTNLFELVAGKRGARLKWKAADGESLCFSKYIGYCKRPDTICWIEMAIAEAEELKASSGKTVEDVLKHVPEKGLIAKDDLIKVCRQNKIGKNLVADLINELVDDDQLYEVPVPRLGKRPKVLISRRQVKLNPVPLLDCWTLNSYGHYIMPGSKPQDQTALCE